MDEINGCRGPLCASHTPCTCPHMPHCPGTLHCMHAFAFVSRFCLARQKRLAQTVESRSCVLNKRSVCNGIVTATVRSGNAGLVPGRRRSCHRNSPRVKLSAAPPTCTLGQLQAPLRNVHRFLESCGCVATWHCVMMEGL
jgi:hypothetical protein